MLEYIKNTDSQLTLWLNSFHTPFMDAVMVAATNHWWWIPLYIFILYKLYKQFGLHGYVYLLGLALVILMADQFTSGLMKPYFERLRPCHEPLLQELLHLPMGCGGLYGMASSHAANTFGAATFLFLIFNSNHQKQVGWLFLWPFMVSYSRVYLGVHYVGDVLTGALVGGISALIAFKTVKIMLPVIYPSYRQA